MRFTRARKLLAAGATLITLGGGAVLAAAPAATAATPSCGTSCISIFPRVYSGQSLNAPQFVLDVLRQGTKVGQPVILFRASNTDPAEDFTLSEQGYLSDFYAAGLVSSAVALHYGCVPGIGQFEFPSCANSVDDTAYEIQYSPYGVDSGLCAGTGTTAASGVKVALEPCGVSGKTVWIEDANPGDNPVPPYYAAINGSDTNFSQPFVMTYPSGYPTDKPRVQLDVAGLTGFSASVDNDNQLWTGVTGVLP